MWLRPVTAVSDSLIPAGRELEEAGQGGRRNQRYNSAHNYNIIVLKKQLHGLYNVIRKIFADSLIIILTGVLWVGSTATCMYTMTLEISTCTYMGILR